MSETTAGNRPALRVSERIGETVRRALLRSGALDTSHRIEREEGWLFFPLNEGAEWRSILSSEGINTEGVESVDFYFEGVERHSGDYRDYLIGVPPQYQGLLPTSFDVVGDIALIKLPGDVQPFSQFIGEALLKAHTNLTAVFQDTGVTGEFRIRKLHHLAGENRTLTVHTEFGIHLRVDPARVYFTPRLAAERHRISGLVKDREGVLDMFAGVGPFSIAIGRAVPSAVVHAIDLNPEAIKLLEENIRLNRVKNVYPHFGDAREISLKLAEEERFQRVIMNLPHSALEFLETALLCVGNGTIHIYDIAEKEEMDEHRVRILRAAEKAGRTVSSLKTTELKGYSPSESMFVHDLQINSGQKVMYRESNEKNEGRAMTEKERKLWGKTNDRQGD